MKKIPKNILSLLLLLSVGIGLLPPLNFTRADESSTSSLSEEYEEDLVDESYDSGETIPNIFQKFSSLSDIANATLLDNSDLGLSLNDLFGTREAKIVLKQTDYLAIKSLYCISTAVSGYPDYNADLNRLAQDSGNSVEKLTNLKGSSKIEEREEYRQILRDTLANWATNEKIIENLQNTTDMRTLECITGISANALAEMKNDTQNRDDFNALINDAVSGAKNSLKLDIRIIKTLIYLVTPAEQGGAGHWRVRVQRIFQRRDYSTESDAIIGKLNSPSYGQTAAAVGQNMREADATIEDQSGQTIADVFISDQTANEDSAKKNLEEFKKNNPEATAEELAQAEKAAASIERNASAHADGQAVDISEIDDIRCTVIGRKRLHLFGGDKKEKKPPQPTKLAWQTNEGYTKSGGNNAYDVMELLRQTASENLRDLVDSLGGDISDYQGDLSQSSLSDLATLIGKSLFSEAINSPGNILGGFNMADTFQKLGSMYLADYLGLPRSLFLGRDLDWIDDVTALVGEASVEKRLNLPMGLLEPAELNSKQSALSLETTLQNIAKRKLSLEMNLNVNDLLEYSKTERLDENSDAPTLLENNVLLIAKKTIEKALDLEPGTFRGKNFMEIKNNIGPLKTTVIISDPAYVDRVLHIPLGSTKKLVSNSKKEEELSNYLRLVGTTRAGDTILGFKYLAAHDSAYGLPEGTWKEAVEGNPQKLREIGIFILARAFGGSDEDQLQAISGWLNDTLNSSGQNCLDVGEVKKKIPIPENQKILNSSGGFKEVRISEETARKAGLARGDLCLLLGSANSNGRAVYERVGEKILYYAFINATANQEGVRAQLEDDPELQITNSDVLFYLTRVKRIQELSQKVKKNWDDLTAEAELEKDADLQLVMNNLISATDGFTVSTVNLEEAKQKAWSLSSRAAELKAKLQEKRANYGQLADKANALVIDINEIYRLTTEIAEGREIPSSALLTEQRIQTTSLNSSASGGRNTKKGGGISLGPQLIFMFLSGRVAPGDFFKNIASQKVESELDLPQNSLTYYLQNLEVRGFGGLDAFYQAIGQAKIEETLKLPKSYFQGPIYKDIPNYDQLAFEVRFVTENGLRLSKETPAKKTLELFASLKKYYEKSSTRVQKLEGEGNIEPSDEGAIIDLIGRARVKTASKHSEAKAAWSKMKKAAVNAFIKDQNERNKNLDNTISDVAKNIDYRGLGEGMRNGESDLMFRFGLVGALSAASGTGAKANWNSPSFSGNRNRAAQIDRDLGIVSRRRNQSSNTQALFSGEKITLSDGRDLLSLDEKNKLLAFDDQNPEKPALVKNALERYLQVLNNEIDLEGFKNSTGRGFYYNNQNPYAYTQRADPRTKECRLIYTIKDGFKVATNTILPDSYVYVDANGKPHSFPDENSAAFFAGQQAERDYLTLMAEYLAGVGKKFQGDYPEENLGNYGYIIDAAQIKTRLEKFLKGEGESVYDVEVAPAIAETLALTLETFEKLFGPRLAESKPLQHFRSIVGTQEAKKILTYRLLADLGVRLDPDDFEAADLYAVLSGDLRPLFRLGSRLIDEGLDLPKGATFALLNVRSLDDVECTLVDAGAQVLGRLFGLQRVDLSADPAEFLNNLGREKIEENLGLNRGSFFGRDLADSTLDGKMEYIGPSNIAPGLLNNIGHLNFALAFEIPLSGEPGNGVSTQTIESAAWQLVQKMFGDKAEQYRQSKTAEKLRLIRDNLAYLDKWKNFETEVNLLNQTIAQRVWELGNVSKADSKFWSEEIAPETRAFIARLDYLDTLFNLNRGASDNPVNSTTFKMLSRQISPDAYVHLVAEKMITEVGVKKIADLLDLSEEEAKAAYAMINNFNNIFNCGGDRARFDQTCGGWSINSAEGRGRFYDGLKEFVHSDLDKKAGLLPGSIREIIQNPNMAANVLLYNSADDLDRKWKLDTQTAADIANAAADLAGDGGGGLADLGNNIKQRSQYGLFKTLYFRATAPKVAKNNQVGTFPKSRDRFGRFKIILSKRIGESIYNATNGSINMPPADIQKLLFKGDMRYLEVAAVSYVQNQFINKENSANCEYGRTPDGQCLLPAGLQVSYDDIRFAFAGDAESEEKAGLAYQYAALPENEDAFAPAEEKTRPYGSVSFDSNTDATEEVVRNHQNINSLPRDQNALRNSNSTALNRNLGINDSSTVEQKLERIVVQRTQWESQFYGEECKEFRESKDDLTSYDTAQLADCSEALSGLRSLDEADELGRKASRRLYSDSLQFRTIDALLWKLDKNVYSGFAWDLIKGSGEAKLKALGTYLLNGVERGELFGLDFKALKEAHEWTLAINYLANINKAGNLDDFLSNKDGSFSFFENKFLEYSEKALGFKLPVNTLGAIIVGAATGNWGRSINDNYVGKNGLTQATLYKTAGDELKRQIFRWADQIFGLPAETVFEAYSLYNNIEKAQRVYRLERSAENLKALNTAKAAFASFVVNSILDATLGKTFSKIDEQLGLSPGTMSMLVGVGVGVGAGALFGIAPNPWAIGAQLVMILALNLFGVYKYEVLCTADGFHPDGDSSDNARLSSGSNITGLGIWNGLNEQIHKQKSIESAQIRARQLVGDVLQMQFNPLYSNVIPNQIMTGREEDVDYWNQLVDDNICKRLGSEVFALGGVCSSGDPKKPESITQSRAGLWVNPQTVGFTHIGF